MSLTRLLNPTGGKVRGTDDYGSGAFGAPRSRDQQSYSHRGLDLTCDAGQIIVSPCKGVVTHVSQAYSGDARYHSIHIQPDEALDADVKLLYVDPARLNVPYLIEEGADLGNAEDLSMKYPGITQHCHLEVHVAGELVDPSPLLGLSDA